MSLLPIRELIRVETLPIIHTMSYADHEFSKRMDVNSFHLVNSVDQSVESIRRLVSESIALSELGLSHALIEDVLPDNSADTLEIRRHAQSKAWRVSIDIDETRVLGKLNDKTQSILVSKIHDHLRGRLPVSRLDESSLTMSYYASNNNDMMYRTAEAFAIGVARLVQSQIIYIEFDHSSPDSPYLEGA